MFKDRPELPWELRVYSKPAKENRRLCRSRVCNQATVLKQTQLPGELKGVHAAIYYKHAAPTGLGCGQVPPGYS